jgi:quinol-cytochrome oxidoreductase complex cytochrome b subunit
VITRLRRWGFLVLAVDFALLAILGIWLAFRYEPGGNSLSTVHGVLGVVAVIAALAAAIGTVGDDERSTAGVLPAVVVLAVVAGMYLTGPTLRWDSIVSTDTEPVEHGIIGALDSDVVAVAREGKAVKASDYRTYAWLHGAALPVALIAMGGAGVWAVRKRRSYVARYAATEVDAET